jgi:lantibiotic modifying enzyme
MWEQLIKRSEYGETYDSITIKLGEIRNYLFHNIENIPPESLFGGYLGQAVFFLEYYKLFKDPIDKEKAILLFERVLTHINENDEILYTFASGISGVVWAIEYYAEDLEILDTNDFIDENIDEVLFNYMIFDIGRKNFDYMHGAVGIGLSFLKRKLTKARYKYICRLINDLGDYGRVDSILNTIRWDYYIDGKIIPNGINLGLSHGLPSFIIFFVKCYEAGILKEKCLKIVEQCVNYLLSVKQNPLETGAYFPYTVEEDDYKPQFSRLAWCYGDIGVTVALSRAQKILKQEKLEKEIVTLLKFCAERKDLKFNSVQCAGLCHGTSGLAHIFNKFYQQYKFEYLKLTSIYWFEETIKMAHFDDGIVGYKVFHTSESNTFVNSSTLLEGVTGTGLSLLSSISSNNPNWDECLLLS